jgi:hypothetical protein
MASTTLPGMITSWWDRHPDAFPCVDCGKSGVVVVDCDVKKSDGVATWKNSGEPKGAVVPTRSGGEHHYYRADPKNPAGVDAGGKLFPSVDVRGVGGMVIVHDVADVASFPKVADLPPVPSVVYDRVPKEDAKVRPDASERVSGAPDRSEASPFELPSRSFTREAAIENILRPLMNDLKSAPHGTINDRLNDAATGFSHFVPHFWSEEEVTRWLLNAQRKAWVASGEEDDGDYTAALATIKSGLAQKQDPWSATLVEPVSSTEVPVPSSDPEKPNELDIAIVRERIRREARRRVDDEEFNARASGEQIAAMAGKVLFSDDLDDIPALEPLIDGWLYKDSVARIVGESGSFKTFVALDMALTVAAQQSLWFGHTVKGGSVIYVAAEGARGIRPRIRAWETEKNDGVRVKDFGVYPEPIQVLGPEWPAFVEVCKQNDVAMVVLDTQARVTVGVNENDNTEMGRVIEHAERLRRDTGACVVLVHHTGYDKSHARGASSVYGALQTELSISRDSNGKKGMTLRLKADKQKDSEELGPVNFKMVPAYDSLVLTNIDGNDEKLETTVEAAKKSLEELTSNAENRAELVAHVLHTVTDGGKKAGMTRPEIRAAVDEVLVKAKKPKMAKSSWNYAFNSMMNAEHVEKAETATRFRLSASGCVHYGLKYHADDDGE